MSQRSRPFPLPVKDFDRANEEVFRRAVEQEVQSIYSTIERSMRGIDAPSSLALRRHQFLLMGAPRG